MPAKKASKPSAKPKAHTASPQFWALNPMVSMVGMAGWSEIVQESVQFVSERMAKDMQAQRDYFNCRSFEDVLKLQAEYSKDALEQYAKQVQRLTELFSKTTALGWSEATASRARSYDDIPL